MWIAVVKSTQCHRHLESRQLPRTELGCASQKKTIGGGGGGGGEGVQYSQAETENIIRSVINRACILAISTEIVGELFDHKHINIILAHQNGVLYIEVIINQVESFEVNQLINACRKFVKLRLCLLVPSV